MTLRLGGRGLVFAALLATDFFSLARLSSLVAENRRRLDRSRIPLLSDLKFMETGAEIYIKWGKSHQDPADGFWVRLQPVEGSPACPVVLLRVLKLTLWGASPCFPVRLQGETTGDRLRREGLEGDASRADLQLLGSWRSRAIDAYLPLDIAGGWAAGVLSEHSGACLAAPTAPYQNN